jgi:hypothetical protein
MKAVNLELMPIDELVARRDVRDRCVGIVQEWAKREDSKNRLLFLLQTMPLKLEEKK